MATDIIARGLAANETARNRRHRILAIANGIAPQSTDALDQTAAIQALLNAASADATSPVRVVFAPGVYNVHGLVIPANVVIEGAGWRSQIWYTRQVRFRLPAGAAAGAMISVADGTNGWGLRGIELSGSVAQGFRALDIVNSKHFGIDGCFFQRWGEQAIRATSGTGFCQIARVVHNLAYSCAMHRTRAGLIGVFELNLTDSEIAGNEAGCSAIAEGVNPAAAALYNAAPRIAACWLTGGGMNALRENVWEISEIGLIDDSHNSTVLYDRCEFNKAWGLLTRSAGGTYIACKFNGNSRAGDGLYAHARIEALGDYQRPRQFLGASFDNTQTAWNFTTTVLASFDDVVYDSYPTYSDPTFYALASSGTIYPVTIRTNDPRIRAIGPQVPVNRGQNGIRNSALAGAVAGVIGSGGALPTDCQSLAGTGLTRTVVGSGIAAGLEYVDIRLAGTMSENYTILSFHPNGGHEIPFAVAGETWTASLFVKVVGGGLANLQQPVLSLREYPADGWNAINIGSNLSMALASDSRPLDQCRFAVTRTLSHANTRRASMWLQLTGTGAGNAIDVTLRLAAPQLEQAATAGLPVRTTGRAVIGRTIDRQAPASGASIVIGSRVEHLILAPAGTLASLTLTLPEAPQDSDKVTVSTSQAITALTMAASAGHTLLAPATTLAAGAARAWRYLASDYKWYPI